MKSAREENPFEDSEIAKQWISAIETPQNRSREKEYYPLLHDWSSTLNSGSIIVEIGSGQGICSSKVNLDKKSYVGIEPSLVLVERSKELYPESSKKFLIGNTYDIPLDAGSIDAVFSIGVWFHLADLDLAHKEIARILKPKGKLLIMTANPDTQKTWESFYDNPVVQGKKIEGKVSVPGGVMSKNILYVHSKDEIVESLSGNGFVVDSVKEIGFGNGDRETGLFIAVYAHKD